MYKITKNEANNEKSEFKNTSVKLSKSME